MQGSGPPGPDLRNPGISCGTDRLEFMKETLHSFIEPKGKTVQGTMKSASQQIRTLSGIGLAPFSCWLIFSLRLLLRVETAISYQKIDPFSPRSSFFTDSTPTVTHWFPSLLHLIQGCRWPLALRADLL